MTGNAKAEQMWAWINGKDRGAALGYPAQWREWFDDCGKITSEETPGQKWDPRRVGPASLARLRERYEQPGAKK